MEAVAQSVPHTCFSNEHLSLFKSREGKEAFHKSWLREIMLEHGSPLKQWGGGDKCARRWRPGDRCVSFRHYLQGSPGEPGVPGRDGLKGEKVGKPQIKFSPYRKKKTAGCDVLSQGEHGRQGVKTYRRLLALSAIFYHVISALFQLMLVTTALFKYTFGVFQYSNCF